MRIGSLFSGVGGMDRGFEQTDVGHTVWQCEYEAFPQAVLRARFPSVVQLGDVTKVEQPPPCDVLVGGPPCQAASVAGKRLGEADDRWMWGHALRILQTAQPRYAVWENPTGLLSLDGGKAFGKILDDHEEAGYGRVAWVRILASDVGAPHRRARVFILAVRDDIELGAATGQVITDDPLETWVRHVVMALQGARVASPWRDDGWPTSGLTMPGGGTWQLPDLTGLLHDGRLVDAVCWPTPGAADGKGVMLHKRGNPSLLAAALATASDDWPTPSARDWKSDEASEETRNRNARPLNEVVLWPTPRSSENDQGRGADAMADGVSSWLAQGRGATLTTAVARWPTPRAGDNRNSRSAITNEKEHPSGCSSLQLEQAIEVSQGILPHELSNTDELPPKYQHLWPTPTRQDGSGSGSGNRTGNPDSKAHAGTSLVDATQRGLWSTPTSSDANGDGDHGEGGQDLRTQAALWATPTAALAGSTGSACADHRRPESLASHVTSEAQWPTPSATPYGSSQNGCPGDGRECYAGKGKPSLDGMAREQEWPVPPPGPLTEREKMEAIGKLSADWVETLMNFPVGWTDVPVPGRKVEVEVDEHGQTRFVELRVTKQGKARTVDRVPLPVREPSPWPGWPAPPGPQYDYEPPRLTDVSAGRPQRLRSLGNSCVPMVAALVGLIVRRLEELTP